MHPADVFHKSDLFFHSHSASSAQQVPLCSFSTQLKSLSFSDVNEQDVPSRVYGTPMVFEVGTTGAQFCKYCTRKVFGFRWSTETRRSLAPSFVTEGKGQVEGAQSGNIHTPFPPEAARVMLIPLARAACVGQLVFQAEQVTSYTHTRRHKHAHTPTPLGK